MVESVEIDRAAPGAERGGGGGAYEAVVLGQQDRDASVDLANSQGDQHLAGDLRETTGQVIKSALRAVNWRGVVRRRRALSVLLFWPDRRGQAEPPRVTETRGSRIAPPADRSDTPGIEMPRRRSG